MTTRRGRLFQVPHPGAGVRRDDRHVDPGHRSARQPVALARLIVPYPALAEAGIGPPAASSWIGCSPQPRSDWYLCGMAALNPRSVGCWGRRLVAICLAAQPAESRGKAGMIRVLFGRSLWCACSG